MQNFKQDKLELFIFIGIILLVFINAVIQQDSIAAIISATCGITYTIFAGRGNPICYIFGVIGSGFYSYLALVNALWGNLLLYLCYYLPMQVLGFFAWKCNLKKGENIVIKTSLSTKKFIFILFISCCCSLLLAYLFILFKGSHPFLDGFSTIFSVAGMYMTVKRSIQQWFFWMVVNGLSFFMWLDIFLKGGNVFSTVLMWATYFILAIYFYLRWKKELAVQ